MATTAGDLLNHYRGTNSETTSFGLKRVVSSGNIGSKDYVILPGMKISVPNPIATAVVVQSFIVEVTPSEEEYLVSSRISNVYELGVNPGQALINYLRLLVNELSWLQKHEDSLSPSIREELRHLQKYVQIV